MYQFSLALAYKSIHVLHSTIIFLMSSVISNVSIIAILHLYQLPLHLSHHTVCGIFPSKAISILGFASLIFLILSSISVFSA
ncbi:hypothetical protein EOM09_03970 [bacterium]|nr:hypothetical protein [bacterium]